MPSASCALSSLEHPAVNRVRVWLRRYLLGGVQHDQPLEDKVIEQACELASEARKLRSSLRSLDHGDPFDTLMKNLAEARERHKSVH